MKLETLKVLLENPAVQPADRQAALEELRVMSGRGDSEARELLDAFDIQKRKAYPPIAQKFVEELGYKRVCDAPKEEFWAFLKRHAVTEDEFIELLLADAEERNFSKGLMSLLSTKTGHRWWLNE
jgi:hypothetical protein